MKKLVYCPIACLIVFALCTATTWAKETVEKQSRSRDRVEKREQRGKAAENGDCIRERLQKRDGSCISDSSARAAVAEPTRDRKRERKREQVGREDPQGDCVREQLREMLRMEGL